MTVLSTDAGVLSKHPQSQTVEEGSTANFTCELKNCVDCPVDWTAVDTETGLHVSVYQQVVTDGNRLTSTISILAVNNTVVQCEEYNRLARQKRERLHYSTLALLLVEKEGMPENNISQHYDSLFSRHRIWSRVQIVRHSQSCNIIIMPCTITIIIKKINDQTKRAKELHYRLMSLQVTMQRAQDKLVNMSSSTKYMV